MLLENVLRTGKSSQTAARDPFIECDLTSESRKCMFIKTDRNTVHVVWILVAISNSVAYASSSGLPSDDSSPHNRGGDGAASSLSSLPFVQRLPFRGGSNSRVWNQTRIEELDSPYRSNSRGGLFSLAAEHTRMVPAPAVRSKTTYHSFNTDSINRLATATLVGYGLQRTARALFVRAAGVLAAGLNRTDSSSSAVSTQARKQQQKAGGGGEGKRPFEPDDESFEAGFSIIQRVHRLQKMISSRGSLGFANNPTPSPSPSSSSPSPYGHRSSSSSSSDAPKLVRPPSEYMFMHVPEALMHPEGWNNVKHAQCTTPGGGGTSNAPPPTIPHHHHHQQNQLFDPSRPLLQGGGGGQGHAASSSAVGGGKEEADSKSKEELVAELKRVAEKFVEGLPAPPKQAIREAIAKALERSPDMPKEQIQVELRLAVDRLKTADKMRHLRQSAWIHSERVIRDGYAMAAAQEGAAAKVNGGPMPPPLRLVPRTLREKFASHMVSLLHPYVDLSIQADMSMERRVEWLPDLLVWMLHNAVVTPLLWAKIGVMTLKRRIMMVVFGSAVLVLPSIPFPLSFVFIRFLLGLFGVG
eukprot:jgi/Bigna1/91392/estExt_fgenesh1_pg.C_990042